jgi:hypothetical protein
LDLAFDFGIQPPRPLRCGDESPRHQSTISPAMAWRKKAMCKLDGFAILWYKMTCNFREKEKATRYRSTAIDLFPTERSANFKNSLLFSLFSGRSGSRPSLAAERRSTHYYLTRPPDWTATRRNLNVRCRARGAPSLRCIDEKPS